MIEAGTPAPEFTLTTEDGGKFTREDLLGKTSVLVFYPFAFSPGCSDQLSLYEEVLDDFENRDATLYAISTDARWSQAAFKERLGSSVRQLSDFEPKGATARAFGVLNDGGFAHRALVIVDAEGVVRWSHQAAAGELPGVNLIFDGLDAADG